MDAGEGKPGIQGASPQPQPVCLAVWWEEGRGKGKLKRVYGINTLFRGKSEAYHVCSFPPPKCHFCVQRSQSGNYRQAPELISAGSSEIHRCHPQKLKSK